MSALFATHGSLLRSKLWLLRGWARAGMAGALLAGAMAACNHGGDDTDIGVIRAALLDHRHFADGTSPTFTSTAVAARTTSNKSPWVSPGTRTG